MMLLFLSARSVKTSSLGLSSTSKITLLSISYLLGSWESKKERRPLINFPLAPDPASMSMNDPLNGRQADARALEFPARMQTLKRAHQLIAFSHLKPHTST